MSDMVNVNFKLDAETKRGMEQACKIWDYLYRQHLLCLPRKSAERNVSRLNFPLILFTRKAICATWKKRWQRIKLEHLNLQNTS